MWFRSKNTMGMHNQTMLIIVVVILLLFWEPSLVLFLFFLAYSLSGYVMWGMQKLGMGKPKTA